MLNMCLLWPSPEPGASVHERFSTRKPLELVNTGLKAHGGLSSKTPDSSVFNPYFYCAMPLLAPTLSFDVWVSPGWGFGPPSSPDRPKSHFLRHAKRAGVVMRGRRRYALACRWARMTRNVQAEQTLYAGVATYSKTTYAFFEGSSMLSKDEVRVGSGGRQT
jgi:hypothetical protein